MELGLASERPVKEYKIYTVSTEIAIENVVMCLVDYGSRGCYVWRAASGVSPIHFFCGQEGGVLPGKKSGRTHTTVRDSHGFVASGVSRIILPQLPQHQTPVRSFLKRGRWSRLTPAATVLRGIWRKPDHYF